MLSFPELFFTLALDSASYTSFSLITQKSKILPPLLMLISLDRREFQVGAISAANFSQMEQKN